jgi:hypothetical protein
MSAREKSLALRASLHYGSENGRITEGVLSVTAFAKADDSAGDA